MEEDGEEAADSSTQVGSSFVLVVTEKGYGKRIAIEEFKTQRRAGECMYICVRMYVPFKDICMCLCMYVFVCTMYVVCMYVCSMYLRMSIPLRVVLAYVYGCMYVCMYEHTSKARVSVCVCMYICMSISLQTISL